MASKRIQKFLENASLRDKISLLLESNAPSNEKGKNVLSKSDIKEITESIVNNGQEEEFTRTMYSIEQLTSRRGELYFESIRLTYYTHFISVFVEKLSDYGRRLAVINSHIQRIKDIPGTNEAIRRLIDSMTDKDPADLNAFQVIDTDEGLKLKTAPLKEYLENLGHEYKNVMEIAKTTYMAFYEYAEKMDITDLIPKDLNEIVGLLKVEQTEISISINKNAWNGLLDLPNIDRDMSVAERFEVAELFPTFEDSSFRDYELGENNRYFKDLKDND